MSDQPVIYVHLYQMRRTRQDDVHNRPQRWRWRAKSRGNNKILASGEAYTNRGDALTAVKQLFGPDSIVYKREDEQGDELLRHPETWPGA